MQRLYVVGGQQRNLRSLLSGAQEWYEYQKGVILEVDPETRQISPRVEYISPPEARAENDAIVLFKSGTAENKTLYVCTQTEILIYALPTFQQVGYVSLPSFNDVHHVRPTPTGNLLVANSGLDMVLELTQAGEIVREWDVLGEKPWTRFSKQIDYRKGVSTKPHRSHPNHVFYIGDEPWVTRFQQQDAISLLDPHRRIHIGVERVHDGVVHGDLIYFTTVNGNVVIAHSKTLQIEEVIDLNALHPADTLVGWCRSISIDDGKAWVGFSRLRPTKWRENVSWVMQKFKRILPTHIGYYDLARRQCLDEIDVEAHGLNAVFSIFPVRE